MGIFSEGQSQVRKEISTFLTFVTNVNLYYLTGVKSCHGYKNKKDPKLKKEREKFLKETDILKPSCTPRSRLGNNNCSVVENV